MPKTDVVAGMVGHWCEPCKQVHYVTVEQPFANGAKWEWNRNRERPTLTPSVRIKWHGGFGPERKERCCHYFVTDGKIQYCADSTHDLAGQTVDLQEIPPDWL